MMREVFDFRRTKAHGFAGKPWAFYWAAVRKLSHEEIDDEPPETLS
jgi:hypothetical protein